EGRGLNVALTCLNYGRCTLSAGMVGAGKAAYEQAVKWAQYRHQFERPLAEFELVQERLARMAAYVYAMDAMLYMTTGIVDRDDEDIMLETAICKIFCSEYGFQTVDNALQVMGGEGYMTENEVERLWRDSRINTIVEGANEVMHSFVFAYGSKQLGEFLLGVKDAPFKHVGTALQIGAELYLGKRRRPPHITLVHPKLHDLTRVLERHTQELSHQVKLMFKEREENLIKEQMIQARLSMWTTWLHAMTCCLSKLDRSVRNGVNGQDLEEEIVLVEHVFALGTEQIELARLQLRHNTDRTMRAAAKVAMRQVGALPNAHYAMPEKTPDPDARDKGKPLDQTHIQQFGSGSTVSPADVPR
ncbi:MAG: acyl-CoA dehydrogenase family protein, partial [Planctomycetota bacterium]